MLPFVGWINVDSTKSRFCPCLQGQHGVSFKVYCVASSFRVFCWGSCFHVFLSDINVVFVTHEPFWEVFTLPGI